MELEKDAQEMPVKLVETIEGGYIEKIDILNRDEFINHVVSIVNKIAGNKTNMTFAINGEWGCGKTFVLDKIQERLENDESKKFLVIPYNCWQYDYYEEPLVAIVSTLLDFLKKTKKVSPKKKEKIVTAVKQLGKVALSAGVHYVEYKTGLNLEKGFEAINGIMDSFDAATSINEKAYDTNFELKDTLEKLKKAFVDLLKGKTIVFCVDELDRCLPEYAIKVLERLHHVSEGVPNMVTIIAVDKDSLKHTVGSIFGENNAERYLKKFIQFEMYLDKGSQNTLKFFEKFSDFYTRFDPSLWTLDVDKTAKFIEELFRDVDIRSQEEIVKEAQIFHDLCFKNEKEKPDCTVMYTELFIVTICRLYKGKNIFVNNNKFNSKNVFELLDMPQKFKDANSGFNFQKKEIVPDGSYTGIVIDESDIFMIVYTYLYYLVKRDYSFKGVQYRPYNINQMKKRSYSGVLNNIDKLSSFQKILP